VNDVDREELRQKIFGTKEQVSTEVSPSINPDLLKLFPPSKIEHIKRKALRRYAARQDIQWQHFLESMSK